MCPIAVVATAATTVLAAFDPLKEIASICEKHSVWLHVDGCFGASVLMSRKHRHLAAGIERYTQGHDRLACSLLAGCEMHWFTVSLAMRLIKGLTYNT